MKRNLVAAFRLQNRNDSTREFLPGRVVEVGSEGVWVKAEDRLTRFDARDFSKRPVVGDRVCYESWMDLTGSGWRIEVV